MPESRSEAETDEKGEKPSKNIISVISQFADDHLTFVRNISTGLAIAGVIVISRSIKLMTRFGVASEIPARFIENNVSLRGRVQTITERALEVEHVPIYIPLLSPLLTKGGGGVFPLAVRLAGVDLTPEGRAWLEQHLSPAQTVWLKLVSREEETLHCLVSVRRGSLRSLCLNDEVLRLGLARTVPVSGLHPQSRLYLRLHQRLLRAEVKAERKGRGMWKEDSLWERTSQAVRENSLVRLIRRIFKWT
ncbi:protein C3orf33 homolog isoform X1 [Coregonus clupeaformis]|uniref:protein C3orf33 homolog isoform X1 n=1 Tax=Coregonus clupeaformis TaxID=59861 RepID=UPI001BDFEB85|nr:protein C3orf33 homolog isoform X1 [Coregonus clupeaformis]